MERLILWLVLAISIPVIGIHILKPKYKIKKPAKQTLNQETRLTPTSSFQSRPTTTTPRSTISSNRLVINKNLLSKTIRTYLENHLIKPTNPKGKVFCENHLYGWQKRADNIQVYIWAYCQELYPRNIKMDDVLGQGEGISQPMLIMVNFDGQKFKVISYKEPKESNYNQSIKEMFPSNYAQLAIQGKPSADNLIRTTYQRARDYFFKPQTYSY